MCYLGKLQCRVVRMPYRYPMDLLILVLRLERLEFLVNPVLLCFLVDPVLPLSLVYLENLVRQ